MQPPLSQAVGYVIVVVLGLIIAGGMFTSRQPSIAADKVVMMVMTKILKKTTGEDNKKTEMYVQPHSCISHANCSGS